MQDLVKGMSQAKSITEQATTEMEQQWEHFFGTLESGQRDASQIVETTTDEISTNWLAVAAVYGAVAAAGTMLIKSIATVSMRTQELGIVAGITAGNMGIGTEVLNGQVEALKKLGMTTQAAMTLTTQFMRSELDLADATKLARAAQNLAIVAMQDSSQAAMTMTRAITMQRPILLRQYGIIGGLSDAYDAMGKSLGILSFKLDSSGKTVRVWSRELTVAEKRQSILNMIMEQSTGLAGAYEAAMDAPGKALRSFGRHIMSAQEALGKYWLPAMDKAVKVATAFIKAFVNAPEIVHQLAGALLVGVTAVSAMTAAIILKTLAAKSMIITVLAAEVTIAGFTMTLAAATLGLSLIVAAIVMLGIKLHEHAKDMEKARQEAFESSKTYEEYKRMMDAAGASAHALSEEIWELAKAEKDAATAQQILIDSADYSDYIEQMTDAGLVTEVLANELWEAEKAQAALTGTTSKTTIEIEKTAQAHEDLIAELKRHVDGLSDLAVASRMLEGVTEEAYAALGEETKRLVLLDPALRDVALALGLVTQAEVEAARKLDILTKAAEEHEARRLEAYASVEKVMGTLEDAYAAMAEAEGRNAAAVIRYVKEQVQARNEAIEAAKEATKAYNVFLESAMADLVAIVQGYLSKTLAAWDSYHASIESAAINSQINLQTSEIKYQRSRQELIAKANAEINALEAAGLEEKAANRQAKLDEELIMLEYNYETQKAWAKWHWDLQQLMQEQAHHLRLAELAEFAMKESQILQAQAEAKLNALRAALSQASMYALGMIKVHAAIVESSVASARGQILAIQAVIDAHKAAAETFEADMSKHLAEVDRISKEIQAMIVEGPQLPGMPDFSQWVKDFSVGMAKSGTGMKESAKETAVSVTKVLKDAIIEIADGFSAAMKIFAEVAEYETPTGLAKGMELLRQDIEEAVRQMYIAYQALGEDGVEGARLIAESADSVIKMLGTAVTVFTVGVANYEGIMPAAIDMLLDDIKYVLIVVRTKLLDLWGWAGEHKDTVWGHMESWATSVGAILDIVAQAVFTFTLLEGYTGIMPGVADALAADIKAVVIALINAIDDGGGLDELIVEWAAFAANLIELVAGMIEDIQVLANLEEGLTWSSVAIESLINVMDQMVVLILWVIGDVADKFEGEAVNVTDRFKFAWLSFNAGLISMVAGMIEDIRVLADLEGGLTWSSVAVESLINVMDQMVVHILRAIGEVTSDFLADDSVDVLKVAWLGFSAGLIALLASVIEDIEDIAAFKGELLVTKTNVENLMDALMATTKFILGAIGGLSAWFDEEGNITTLKQLKQKWIEFATGLISLLAGTISDMENIAAFKGDLVVTRADVRNLMDALFAATKFILGAIGDLSAWFDEEGNITASKQLKQKWIEFAAGLIGTLAGVIENAKKISAFEGDLDIAAAKVQIIMLALVQYTDAILDVFEQLPAMLGEGIFRINEAAAAWLEFSTGLLSLIAGAVDDIEKLAAFEGVDETAFGVSLDNLFDALYWFLDEFEQRAGVFAEVVSETSAEIARLMGETVSSLGQCVDPILKVAEFAVTPAEAEVAIGLFFEALWLFLKEFKENAVEFGKKVDKDIADLAKIIGDTVSGIGSAVGPLVKILEYNPEVVDIEDRFEEFFGHLASVLWWIETEKSKWAISTAAQELAAGVEEVMGHLKVAVDFLDEMATYGEGTTVSALTGFLSFLIDLMLIIGAINDARDRITEEALSAAEEFASGCSTLLGHITDGISTLNSLPQLEIDFYLTGEGLGVNFIQGMIDGLINNSSALYQVIMDIVAAAIAAAEDTAGVASRSEVMFNFGNQMTQGLIEGLQAQQSGVLDALTGMLSIPDVVLSPQLAGVGGGNTYQYTYREAVGRGPRERNIRQDFEAMEIYQRLRG